MSGSTIPQADVEIVLDLRDLAHAPSSPSDLGALWAAVEPELVGRDMRPGQVHELTSDDGVVRLEVVHAVRRSGPVRPSTRYSIVGVREAPHIRYRCRPCSSSGTVRYGPFICGECGADTADNRVCDTHVSILDGALVATCDDHRPGCTECGRPATFRCAGDRCRRAGPWCDQHRRSHPQNGDLDYCPRCFDALFPRCESPGCDDIGTVSCEFVGARLRTCGSRMCTRHAGRWQVFGAERLGLGRCSGHRRLVGLEPDEVVRQIVVGTARRGRNEHLPTLQGFGHNLRRCGHPGSAVDYQGILRRVKAVGERSGDRDIVAVVTSAESALSRQLAGTATAASEGQRLVERLRQIVLRDDPRFGEAIAQAISLAEFKPSRERQGVRRPGMLFVRLPADLRGPFHGRDHVRSKAYGEQLGVELRIEKDDRRT